MMNKEQLAEHFARACADNSHIKGRMSLSSAMFDAGYEAATQWIPVTPETMPPTNKLNESEYLLCLTPFEQFVGWYNSKTNSWHVGHFLASSKALTDYHIPTHYRYLDTTPPKQIT